MQAQFELGCYSTRTCGLVDHATKASQSLIIAYQVHELRVTAIGGEDDQRSPRTSVLHSTCQVSVVFVDDDDVSSLETIREDEVPSLGQICGKHGFQQLYAPVRIVEACQRYFGMPEGIIDSNELGIIAGGFSVVDSFGGECDFDLSADTLGTPDVDLAINAFRAHDAVYNG